ncbi:MAG: AAA family ATPase, partial [Succinivibrio sp.]|nr:AAA family ATPase [Succinivibrio sp.]
MSKEQVRFFSQPGDEDFSTLITEGAYYVDKTRFLDEIFMRNHAKNLLILRPRRFGKTLNQSMIKAFLELDYQNPGNCERQKRLFIDNGRNLTVAAPQYRELRERFMGQYPVIAVSFRELKGRNFKHALSSLMKIIASLYTRFTFLLDNPRLTSSQQQLFEDILKFSTAAQLDITAAQFEKAVNVGSVFVSALAAALHQVYGRKVLVLIDEYDVPLQKAMVAAQPYYEEMLDIIRQLSSSTFKQDPEPWLFKGIVTGCLRIAHQSVFTDANNFVTVGMNHPRFAAYCG